MVGWMICLWSSAESASSSFGEAEVRAERAEDRVWDASFACRLCSSMKLSILSRPWRVSDLQFRSVFSSVLISVVWVKCQ